LCGSTFGAGVVQFQELTDKATLAGFII